MFKKFIRFVAAVLAGVTVYYSPNHSMEKAEIFKTCVDGISWIVSYVESLELPAFFEDGQENNDSHNDENDFNLQNRPHYVDDPYITGVDVSYWQGYIDWHEVADSGIEFAIIRTGFGTSGEDDWFHYNFWGAKDAGLLVGVYHYSYASTLEKATEEAEYVCSLLEGKELDLPVFYDQEDLVTGVTGQDNGDVIGRAACARNFLEIVESNGHRGGLYFPAYLGELYYDESQGLTEYPLWIAVWSDDIYRFDNPVACWQYSNSGVVSGIDGAVDLNRLWLPQ